MKLYTEEQLYNTVIAISNYLDDIDLSRAQDRIEKHLKALEPIELPTDEEIENYAMGYYNNNGAEYYVRLGAQWYREQLKKK